MHTDELREKVRSWVAANPAPEPDFAYHTVYGSKKPVFDESAVLIDYTVNQTCDVSGSAYGYFHVTTSDFAPNESVAASIVRPVPWWGTHRGTLSREGE